MGPGLDVLAEHAGADGAGPDPDIPMPTTYTNRVLTILLTIWIAASAIYPRVPGSLFWFFNMSGPVSFEHALKPGIDMAGGTSLTYEIRQPEGGAPDPDLAERVATALKKRVDPNGVRNLLWRPQGSNRLEIQMPMTQATKESAAIRDRYTAARDKLESMNLPIAPVTHDIETLTGAERDAKIAQYAGDSPRRLELLQQMAKLSDEIKAARARGDANAAAEARLKYEPLQTELQSTNLSIGTLESALELAKQEDREARLKAIKDRFAGSPQRLAAIDEFVEAFNAYLKVRDSLDDAADLKYKLKGSGVLSFRIVANDIPRTEYEQWVKRLHENGPRPEPGDHLRWFESMRPEEFAATGELYNGKRYVLCHVTPEHSMINGEGLPQWALTRVKAGRDNLGGNAVDFAFDSRGAQLFGELTGRWTSRNGQVYLLAILLDDKVVSAPSLPDRPIFADVQVSSRGGGFSKQELDYLVSTLSAGSLPAQLTDEPISEITVGPQLGADNLIAGLISCVAALVIVFVFLFVYYYVSGLVAFLAVLVNLLLIVGSMAAINATFTLPGIAGIVLSVAMAVDANVLIFERLREEQARGLSLKMAMRNAYDRAFSAILDGQLTTAITSVFLFAFGSEEVRGFGLTLLIGIVTSLFTALFITRTVFGIMMDKWGVKDLGSLPRTFPRWNEMLTPRLDWIKLAPACIAFSVLFIGIGLAMLGVKMSQNQAFDIEFSGGTAVHVALKESHRMPRDQLQELVDELAEQHPEKLASPRVVALGNAGLEYEISTPSTDTRGVQEVVIQGLGDKLDIAQPSRFAGMDADFASAANQTVFPISSASERVADLPLYLTQGHVGGVAIILDNLDPPLTPEQIRSRIDQRKGVESNDTRPERVEVQALNNENTKAVVLISDPRYVYSQTNATALQAWQTSLAGPAWQIVKDAVGNPPQLKGVTAFNAQVADEAKWNTVMALTMSVLGIMAYIWARFGNLKYGTATVIGCAHDALFVIAAVGWSHYLTQIGFFEDVLLIKPFRIDLTLVAAVLTVVGYSMNDTVVVFDRVRENRGKFGILSRKVVNDSINQTFSRTLLTGGTSIVIMLVMYIIGGDGIHGFAFTMLLGIVVGTYSSIVISSPFLLIGKDEPAASPSRASAARPATAG